MFAVSSTNISLYVVFAPHSFDSVFCGIVFNTVIVHTEFTFFIATSSLTVVTLAATCQD